MIPDKAKAAGALQRQRLAARRSATPIPDRISSALTLRNLYGPEVDIACGATEPDVDRWEDPNDPLLPDARQVALLSKLTGFPVEYFYQPSTVKVGVIAVCSEDGCDVADLRPDATVLLFPGASPNPEGVTP